MATRIVKLTGIGEWAKVFEDNRDMQGYDGVYEACNGACTIDVILDEDNLTKLKASRSIKRGKPDPEGRGPQGVHRARAVGGLMPVEAERGSLAR